MIEVPDVIGRITATTLTIEEGEGITTEDEKQILTEE